MKLRVGGKCAHTHTHTHTHNGEQDQDQDQDGMREGGGRTKRDGKAGDREMMGGGDERDQDGVREVAGQREMGRQVTGR